MYDPQKLFDETVLCWHTEFIKKLGSILVSLNNIIIFHFSISVWEALSQAFALSLLARET